MKLKCKLCGDIIESNRRHDLVWCTCKSCYVDGGTDYFRFGGNKENFEVIKDEKEN